MFPRRKLGKQIGICESISEVDYQSMEGMWTQRLVVSKSGKLINNDGLRVYRPNVILKVITMTAPIAKGKVTKFNNSN